MKVLFEKRRIFIISLLLILGFGTGLRIFHNNVSYFYGGVDEGIYLQYAHAFKQTGFSKYQLIIKNYLNNPKLRNFPHPFRIGFIYLSFLFCKIFNNWWFTSIAWLSTISSIFLLVISYAFAKRLFSQKVALFSTLLICVSPLQLGMARRALQTSTVTLFFILALFTFYLMLKERKLIYKILFVTVLSFGILVKESILYLYPILFSFLIYKDFILEREWRMLWKDSAALGLPVVLVAVIFVLVSGGIGSVMEVARGISKNFSEACLATNIYMRNYDLGPWYRIIIDYLAFSPFTTLLVLGWCVHFLLKSSRSEEEIFLFIILVGSIVLSNFFLGKNIRNYAFLDIPIRIASVILLNELGSKWLSKKAALLCLGLVTVLLMVLDYTSFAKFFLVEGIYDPVTYLLIRARRMIPWVK